MSKKKKDDIDDFIAIDQIEQFELTKNSLLVFTANPIPDHSIIQSMCRQFSQNLDFRIPIIFLDGDSKLEDIGVEHLIKNLASLIKDRPEIMDDLKKAIKE